MPNAPTPAGMRSAPATAIPSPSSTPSPNFAATAAAALPKLCRPPSRTATSGPELPIQVEYRIDGTPWVWREGVTLAVATAPPPTVTPVHESDDSSSDDGQLTAFERKLNDKESEIWVRDAAGSERKLVLTSAAETWENYRDTWEKGISTTVSMGYWWLPGTHKIAYTYYVSVDALGDSPYEAVRVADADTAAAYVLIPAAEVNVYRFSPDGRQIAALTNDELRLIRVDDGTVTHALKLPFVEVGGPDQVMTYTPDGKQLVLFVKHGVAIVDPATGIARTVPLDYEPIGMGESSVMPQVYWLPGKTAFLTLVAKDNQVLTPDAAFSVFRVDVAEPSVAESHSYLGDVDSAELSPDLKAIVSMQQLDNRRTI